MCALEREEHSVLVVLLHLLTEYQYLHMWRHIQTCAAFQVTALYLQVLWTFVMDMCNAILLLQGACLRRIAQDVLKNTLFFNCMI